MSEENTLTVAEFKTWIDTIEEFTGEGNDWYPTETQWRKIRDKINRLEELSVGEAIRALQEEVEKLKGSLSQSASVVTQQPRYPAASPVVVPESTLDITGAPVPVEPPPSGRVAPTVTMPPAVQTGQPGVDGQPSVKIPPKYDEAGNYSTSFE